MISATTISPLNRRIVDGGAPAFSFGNALQFDGVNDFVNIGSNINPSKSNNFGFSGWFKTSNSSSIANRISNPFIGEKSSGWITSVGINGGKVASMNFDGSTIHYNEGSTNFSDGNWHCVSVFRTIGASGNFGTISVWVDGVLEINESNYDVGGFNYKWIDLGANRTTEKFTGVLDEFVFYQAVGLSVGLTEHNAFYNNGNGALATDIFTNIYAFYNCNGTSGDSTLLDSINSYNGTLNNFNTATCWVAH